MRDLTPPERLHLARCAYHTAYSSPGGNNPRKGSAARKALLAKLRRAIRAAEKACALDGAATRQPRP